MYHVGIISIKQFFSNEYDQKKRLRLFFLKIYSIFHVVSSLLSVSSYNNTWKKFDKNSCIIHWAMFFFFCSQKTLIPFNWLELITKFVRKSYSGHCISCLDQWIMIINDFLHSIWVIFWKYCEIIRFTRAFSIVYW